MGEVTGATGDGALQTDVAPQGYPGTDGTGRVQHSTQAGMGMGMGMGMGVGDGEMSPTAMNGMGTTTQSGTDPSGSYGASGDGEAAVNVSGSATGDEGSGAMHGNAPLYAFQIYDPYHGTRSVRPVKDENAGA